MATRIENVLCFGDSIGKGHGTPDRMGWVQQLAAHYRDLNSGPEEANIAEFHELCIPAEWSGSFARRAALAADPELLWHRPHRRAMSVISVGAHDPWMNVRRLRSPTETTEFQHNFTIGIRELLRLGGVLYVGIPAPDDTILSTYPKGPLMVRDILRLYESISIEIVTDMATNLGRSYAVVPLLESTMQDPTYGVNEHDHRHPNDQGHKRIFEMVRPIFDEMVDFSESQG